MSLEQYEEFLCPYCSANNTLQLDFTGGSQQKFVVDCEVCCSPIVVEIQMRGREIIRFEVNAEND